MILAYYLESRPNEDIPVQVAQEVAAEHRRKYQIQNFPATEELKTTEQTRGLSVTGGDCDISPVNQEQG
jgi:hypothetical protein